MSKEENENDGEKEKGPNYTEDEDKALQQILPLIVGVVNVAALQRLLDEGNKHMQFLVSGKGIFNIISINLFLII